MFKTSKIIQTSNILAVIFIATTNMNNSRYFYPQTIQSHHSLPEKIFDVLKLALDKKCDKQYEELLKTD